MGDDHGAYPIHLGLAYLFLVGYLIRTCFIGLRLPGAVGVIVSGFIYSFFMQGEILSGRDHLQALSFFLVLLTAGTEISLGDLKLHIIICAIVPATFELLGIAVYAVYVMEWTPVEAAVLGVALFGLGDGLVIPKMSEFGHQFPGHPLPRFLFIWAPLEASYALTLFGVISGVAEPAGEEMSHYHTLALANVLRIFATLGVGALVGASIGWIVSNRSWLPVPLTGTTVEAYLFLLASALAGFGLSTAEYGPPMVPIGLTSGSLFQPELMVIVIGSLFARVVEPETLHSVELTMGGVWVFGQLILFSMLGSKTEVGLFTQVTSVLPIMVVGFALRFVGVLLVTAGTLWIRPCTCSACFKANKQSILTDAAFCFLGTLPRATLQGALGQVPITERFFHHDPHRKDVQMFISIAARLYIVIMSVVGSILLDALGPRMLQANKLREVQCEKFRKVQEEMEQGWTLKERKLTVIPDKLDVRPTMTGKRSTLSRASTTMLHRASTRHNLDVPLRGSRKSSAFENEPLVGRVRSESSQQAEDLRPRFSTWSALHQLEGRYVEEPSSIPEEGEDESELWDGGGAASEAEEDQKSEVEEAGQRRVGGQARVLSVKARNYKDGDFLPNTNIRGESVQECAVSPL